MTDIGIPKELHWPTDYSYIPLVYAAPKLAGFSEDRIAANICCGFSAVVLGYSLLTDAKWGAVKLIPYKTHAVLDFTAGIAALAVPLIVKNVSSNKKVRNTFLLMGITGIVVGVLSLMGAKKKEL